MQTPFSGELVKNAGAISWSEVGSGEAALLERCRAGDDAACAELVSTHQRMVFTLSVNNLTNRPNFSGFSGIQTSPFFMTPTSVQNPRKIDIGVSLRF